MYSASDYQNLLRWSLRLDYTIDTGKQETDMSKGVQIFIGFLDEQLPFEKGSRCPS